MIPANLRSNTYIDFDSNNNDKDLRFKLGDHVRILEDWNIFAKVYTSNWTEVFVTKKFKILCCGCM